MSEEHNRPELPTAPKELIDILNDVPEEELDPQLRGYDFNKLPPLDSLVTYKKFQLLVMDGFPKAVDDIGKQIVTVGLDERSIERCYQKTQMVLTQSLVRDSMVTKLLDLVMKVTIALKKKEETEVPENSIEEESEEEKEI